MPGRKRSIAALAGVAGAAHALPALAAISDRAAGALEVMRALPGAPSELALTFDDGPHALGTPAVLAALESRGAVATFFMVGEQIRRDPGLAREVIDRGHAVGIHCDRHRSLLLQTPRQIDEDLRRAEFEIASVAGAPVAIHRPPYGLHSLASLAAVRRRGWRTVLWSTAGRDWRRRASVKSIADDATRGIGGGEVVLLHDADDYGSPGSWRRTADALPRILERIEAAGIAPVTLGGGVGMAALA